jgi:hypothetical protein
MQNHAETRSGPKIQQPPTLKTKRTHLSKRHLNSWGGNKRPIASTATTKGSTRENPPLTAKLTALGRDEKKRAKHPTSTPKVQRGKTKKQKSITSANVERGMIPLMKMKNSIEQDLKFAKERSNGRARPLKNSFIPLILLDDIDQNTKRSTPHSAICIVTTPM